MASENPVGCVLLKEGRAKPFPRGTKPKALPEWDRDRCIKCGICYLFCPDAAITKVDEGYFDVTREYCKGCGICQQECWFGAISMAEEV
jgi:pyruvate ferredoxin oxidoreductase delta subunit